MFARITLIIASLTFSVPPNPVLVIRYAESNKEIDLRSGLNGQGPFTLRITAEEGDIKPDSLQPNNPYKVERVEYILIRKGARVRTLLVKDEIGDLHIWAPEFREGDKIMINVQSVVRTSPEGKRERVVPVANVITIPIF